MHQHYSVTNIDIELLAIVETLKEFKGMLWGQKLKVFTDHKNLIQDALGLTSDRVYWWRLLLEEFGPEIVHIKGIQNTVADAISRLDFGPVQDEKANWMTFTKCWCHYTMQATPMESTTNQQQQINMNLLMNSLNTTLKKKLTTEILGGDSEKGLSLPLGSSLINVRRKVPSKTNLNSPKGKL